MTIICFLVLPLVFILVYSFLTAGTYGGVEWIFSTEAYVQFLFERDLFTARQEDLSQILDRSLGIQVQQSGGLGSFSTITLRCHFTWQRRST